MNGEKWGNRITVFCFSLLGALFLPVLCCVIFAGNHMDYNEGMKLKTLLPNYILCGAAVLGAAASFGLARVLGGLKLTKRVNYTVNGILALAFVLLYFLNVWVAKEIAFQLPWDIMMVRGIARDIAQEKPLGEFTYLSVYTNNLPISYIMGWLLKKAKSITGYPYFHEFIWIQVNCVFISVAGFFSCLTVKKLTHRLMPVAAAFLMYLALAGISAWKIAPYTDTYGMIFPIMCVYFYLCCRDAEKRAVKCLYAALALLCGMTGGLIKPSVYVMVIAVLGVEFVDFLRKRGNTWKYFVLQLLLAAGLFVAGKAAVNRMIDSTELDYNPEVSAGWQNYFYMGLNEGSTGSYASEDVTIFGEFQTDRKERNRAALERAWGRISDRGVFGTVFFWLRKMVMTFNDGTFGWECEVWIDDPYPADLAGNTAATRLLRNIFWPNMPYTGRYNTFCQLVWMFCILGLSGIFFLPQGKREKYLICVVSFTGIFLYQMLFEARARYLFAFLPLLTAISACGMGQYWERIESLCGRSRGSGRRFPWTRQEQEAEILPGQDINLGESGHR